MKRIARTKPVATLSQMRREVNDFAKIAQHVGEKQAFNQVSKAISQLITHLELQAEQLEYLETEMKQLRRAQPQPDTE